MPFQAPKGTRDFYPHDLLRRRYIIDTWRRVSLRHGFEEIDGPTFEDSALYTVKSGEGILNELFGAYSGKDPADTQQVQGGGPPPFALRPEFTPTLARMYAARAKQLPQPTKWFCVSNFFRAERPQRGRLREFWQWNCDILGDADRALADVETVAAMWGVLAEVGLPVTERLTVHLGSREILFAALRTAEVDESRWMPVIAVLDARAKYKDERAFESDLVGATGSQRAAQSILAITSSRFHGNDPWEGLESFLHQVLDTPTRRDLDAFSAWKALHAQVRSSDFADRLSYRFDLARGLAYYTGTVFELIAEGERAVAGGGRYDKLIELFGGPSTPAVGFGMGDVVLTNLLDDRTLMPEGRDLLEATSRPLPVRPDVFVIANEKDESQARVAPLVASLRRGVETEKSKQGECTPWSTERYSPSLGGVPPLHARRSYKATKNIGKLLGEATACHARFALIIENAETGTLKNLDTREEVKDVPLDAVGSRVAGSG